MVALCTEVYSFQGVGIEESHCIKIFSISIGKINYLLLVLEIIYQKI